MVKIIAAVLAVILWGLFSFLLFSGLIYGVGNFLLVGALAMFATLIATDEGS